MPDPLILEHVVKRYGRGTPVVDGLSRTFEPGTGTGLVGPNGSGKTTLLRLLAAVAQPTEGRVRYGTLDVHAHPHRYLRHVGVLLEDEALPRYLSAEEVLEWLVRAHGGWDADAPARIHALLDAVRLDERRSQLIGTYSSGMLKKTQVAAALVNEPDVVLLDEPFRALDDASRAAVVGLLQDVKRRGGLLIVSSHLQHELDALTDEVLSFHPAEPAAAAPEDAP